MNDFQCPPGLRGTSRPLYSTPRLRELVKELRECTNGQMGQGLVMALMNEGQLLLACNQQRLLTFQHTQGGGSGGTKAEALLLGSGCWGRRRVESLFLRGIANGKLPIIQ